MKRTLSLLIVILTMLAFTACGAGNSGEGTNPSKESVTETTEMAAESTDTYISTDFKFDGKAFRFMKEHRLYNCHFNSSDIMDYDSGDGDGTKEMTYGDSFKICLETETYSYDTYVSEYAPSEDKTQIVEINGIPWQFYNTTDDTSTTNHYVYADKYTYDADGSEWCHEFAFTITSYLPESELDLDKLSEVYMNSVTISK